MILYYNPDCSKCQAAKQLLEDRQCTFVLRNYLTLPPDKNELQELVRFLGCRALDIVRTGDALYLELSMGTEPAENELLDMLAANPLLLQRPIVVEGDRAIIGRPPELILTLTNTPPAEERPVT